MGCHTWFFIPGRKFNSPTDSLLTKRINNKWYIESANHDLFRVCKYNEDGTYPEDILKSMEETKSFIEKQQVKRVHWERLETFWKQYPNGIIIFE